MVLVVSTVSYNTSPAPFRSPYNGGTWSNGPSAGYFFSGPACANGFDENDTWLKVAPNLLLYHYYYYTTH